MGRVRRFVGPALLAGLLLASGCGRTSSGTVAKSGSGGGVSSLAAGDFGTMKAVCGPAPQGETNTATGRGVTANSIHLGAISDAGFVGQPGLEKEVWDASDVFTKWCNSVGGINGRKIVDNHLDSALTLYRQVILEACQLDFALVGGGGAFDDVGQADRLRCLLPSFPAFGTTALSRGAEL